MNVGGAAKNETHFFFEPKEQGAETNVWRHCLEKCMLENGLVRDPGEKFDELRLDASHQVFLLEEE